MCSDMDAWQYDLEPRHLRICMATLMCIANFASMQALVTVLEHICKYPTTRVQQRTAAQIALLIEPRDPDIDEDGNIDAQ